MSERISKHSDPAVDAFRRAVSRQTRVYILAMIGSLVGTAALVLAAIRLSA